MELEQKIMERKIGFAGIQIMTPEMLLKLETLPRNRSDAKRSGIGSYCTFVPCLHGHVSYRLTSNGVCYICSRIRKKEFMFKNKERERLKTVAQCKKWREKNKEKAKLYSRKYKNKNSENLKEMNKEYRKRNKNKLKKYFQEYGKINRKKITNKTKRWIKNNPEAWRVISENRRAREKNADGFHKDTDIGRIKILQKYKCAICRISINKKYTIDHIIPLSKGGSNWPKNIQLVCKSCNSRKGAKIQELFMREGWFLL